MTEIPFPLYQDFLSRLRLDGWLLYDFQGQNPIARRVARFPEDRLASRRWFYFIPSHGDPVGIVHAIESHHLSHLPGRKLVYAGWREMRQRLSEATSGARRIAMEYSPNCHIPYVSRVDAGIVELLRGLGKDITSSADLVSLFESRLTDEQIRLHVEAASVVVQVKDRAFEEIAHRLQSGRTVDEYHIQQYILDELAREGLTTSSPPLVAVNEHGGDPHYSPFASSAAEIRPGDLILIDLWGKLDHPEAVYADFTWVGYAGPEVPPQIHSIWEIVAGARDAALDFIVGRVRRKEPFCGYQVDDVARAFITERGYGRYFFHRTGHNIGRELHGNGAHMDNYETHDDRQVLPRTVFSVEPGIYLPEFGIRSEVNVLVLDDRVEITGQPMQKRVLCLLPAL